MQAVVTGEKAFDTATVPVHPMDGWIGLLGAESSRAPSIVVEEWSKRLRAYLMRGTLHPGKEYHQIEICARLDVCADRYCVQHLPETFTCILATMHVGFMLATMHVGLRYDIALQARPRLSAAWVLFNANEVNVFRAVIAAGTHQLFSRGRHLESSTSAKQRTVLCTLQHVKALLPKDSALLLSIDSDGTRQVIDECCLQYRMPGPRRSSSFAEHPKLAPYERY